MPNSKNLFLMLKFRLCFEKHRKLLYSSTNNLIQCFQKDNINGWGAPGATWLVTFCSTLLGIWARAIRAMVVKVSRECHDHYSVVDTVSWRVESNVESGTMQETSKYLLCSLNMSGSEDPGKQTMNSFVELNQRLKQEQNTLITISVALDTVPYGIRFVT